MVHFFADAPWLNIPLERQGEILVEPLYPRGGLLGGSSNQGGSKVSKLAALAAARKKKENEKPNSTEFHEPNSSVALLDRLRVKTQEKETTGVPEPTIFKSEDFLPPQGAANTASRKYVSKRRESSQAVMPSKEIQAATSPSITIPKEPAHNPAVQPMPTAAPSTFAKVILGPTQSPEPSLEESFQHLTISVSQFINGGTKLEPFVGPSPDDVVIKAQNSSKGSARKAEVI